MAGDLVAVEVKDGVGEDAPVHSHQFLGGVGTTPRVTGIGIRSSEWDFSEDGFAAELTNSGLADIDGFFALSSDSSQLDPVPWSGLNQIRIRFDQDVEVRQGDAALTTGTLGALNPSAFEYDAGSHLATWTFSSSAPIIRETLQLNLSEQIKSVASGDMLDGEYTTGEGLANVGDGKAGGDFHFRFDVLGGDANRSGRVNTSDLSAVSASFNLSPVDPTYNPFADFNGSGRVNTSDLNLLSQNFNRTPPIEQPQDYDFPPPLPGSFSILGPTGFVSTATPTVSWSQSEFAASYDVTIASDNLCNTAVQEYSAVMETLIAVSPIAEGDYFICVVARNETGSELATNTGLGFSFDITPPGPFAITNPTEGASIGPTPVLLWEIAAEATSYQWVVSTLADLSDVVQSGITADTQVTLETLVPGTYYAGVTAADEAGNEIESENQSLSFQVEAAAEPLLIFTTFSAYVNDGDTSSYPPSFPFFGETRAADWYATREANDAGLIEDWDFSSIIYRAIISGADGDARDRLEIGDRPLFNPLGQKVADNAADLFDGSIQAPLNRDALGNDLSIQQVQTVWTGSSAGGSNALNCSDWSAPGEVGVVGDMNAADSAWIAFQSQYCFSQARFYAVGPFDPYAFETDPPQVGLNLVEDTDIPDDGITSNPELFIQVSDTAPLSEVRISLGNVLLETFDRGEIGETRNLEVTFDPLDPRYGLNPGSPVEWTFTVEAEDYWGNVSAPISLTFTYVPPSPPGSFLILGQKVFVSNATPMVIRSNSDFSESYEVESFKSTSLIESLDAALVSGLTTTNVAGVPYLGQRQINRALPTHGNRLQLLDDRIESLRKREQSERLVIRHELASQWSEDRLTTQQERWQDRYFNETSPLEMPEADSVDELMCDYDLEFKQTF